MQAEGFLFHYTEGKFVLGLTEHGEILIRGRGYFRPHSYQFDLEQVRYIRSPKAGRALEFLSVDKFVLGVLNPGWIPAEMFNQFLRLVRQHNPHIKFLDW